MQLPSVSDWFTILCVPGLPNMCLFSNQRSQPCCWWFLHSFTPGTSYFQRTYILLLFRMSVFVKITFVSLYFDLLHMSFIWVFLSTGSDRIFLLRRLVFFLCQFFGLDCCVTTLSLATFVPFAECLSEDGEWGVRGHVEEIWGSSRTVLPHFLCFLQVEEIANWWTP